MTTHAGSKSRDIRLNSGFSLGEVIVVMAIMTILASIAIQRSIHYNR